jgi:hypothetical protein
MEQESWVRTRDNAQLVKERNVDEIWRAETQEKEHTYKANWWRE